MKSCILSALKVFDKESIGIECFIFLNLLVIGAPTLDLIDPYFLR